MGATSSRLFPNLHGPGDNFDLESAHVLPAFLHRFRAAALAGDSEITIWGTGRPRREFLHVDDCADALVYLRRHYSDASTINVGVGRDVQGLTRCNSGQVAA
jgi:GDP-L-fucose synthase